MKDNHEPYVGPRPFTQDDRPYFFGRDREANELLSLIIAHPVVLLYAQSGAGKTSLLNASIIPLLRERSSQIFGTARVSGQLPPQVKEKDVSNIYVFHSLLSLESDISDPAGLVRMSLGEYLKARSGPRRTEGLSTRRVVVFDQFEEVFTTSQERWSEREGFFDSVGSALEKDPSLRVVFSMREEYLASMDPYVGFLPERLRTRFRLERLRKRPALLAVEKPLEKTDRKFAPGAADQLVESLLKVPIKSATGAVVAVSEEFVEPVQLQVVCQNLWQKLPPEVRVIEESYIEDYGDVDQALSTYYDDCVAKVAEEFKGEVKEGDLRRWFGKRIITPDGLRGIVYRDDATETTGDLPNKVVDLLENLRLVRPESRGGAAWYELTHDRFISPILQSNQRWLAARDKGNVTSRTLEARAEGWHSRGRASKDLLQSFELGEVKDWMNSPYATEIGVSDTLKDFVKASKDKVGRTRLLQLLGVVALLLIAAVAFIIHFFNAKSEAEEAKSNALGQVASRFSQLKNPFEALYWGIKAVGPHLKQGEEPPDQALNGLRDAVKLIGNGVWLRGPSTSIAGIEFSPDGKLALVWSKFEASVFDSETGELISSKKSADLRSDLKEGWDSVGFSPDGRFLVADFLRSYIMSGSRDNNDKNYGLKETYTQFIWDARTGEPPAKLQAQLKGVVSMIFSPDGSHILLREYDQNNVRLRLFIADSGEQLAAFQFPAKRVSWISFLPDDTRVLILFEGRVRIWDIRTGMQLLTLSVGPPYSYYSSVLSHDGSYIALVVSFGEGNNSGVWDLRSGRRIFKFVGVDILPGNRAVFSPDDKSLALLESDGTLNKLHYFEVATGKPAGAAEMPGGEVVTIGGTTLAVSHEEENGKTAFRARDLFSGKVLAELPDVAGEFSSATFSPDLGRVMAYNKDEKDNLVYIWKVKDVPLEAGKLSAAQLYGRACSLLRYQRDYYSDVKAECESPLPKK